jgi:hypothetical protein
MVNETGIIVNQSAISNLSFPESLIDKGMAKEAVDNLISEVGEEFYNYINRIGLTKDPNVIVLSSRHDYFYDAEEINNAKTVINLKELNQIKQINSLLQSCRHLLPKGCNFVGYFVNNKKSERYILRNSSNSYEHKKNLEAIELGIISRFPFINRLYSIMDSRTNTYMSERSVVLLLKLHGFKVIDMTEFNGLTFFHSQKVGQALN